MANVRKRLGILTGQSNPTFAPLPAPVALANESDPAERVGLVGLSNEIQGDGWVRLAPYGELPKTRTVRRADGQVITEHYLQVLDREGAQDLARGFNSLWGRLKRAFASVPLYRSHPDLARVAPETALGNSAAEIPVGAIQRLEARGDGLYAQVSLFPAGQLAVENEGLKWISPLWWTVPVGSRGHAILVRPVEMISGGLTDSPNISGGEALANSSGSSTTPAASSQGGAAGSPVPNDTMKPQLIGLLAAYGVILANDTADDKVLGSLQTILAKGGDKTVALENEKTTLTGRITALENEKATLTADLTKAGADLTAAQTALANERKERATALVDLAIAQGKLAVADREARITRLTSAADFTAEATALANEAIQHRTGAAAGAGAGAGERKGDAHPNRSPRDQALALANELVTSGKATDFDAAWQAVRASHPALFEAMRQKTN